MGWMVVCYVAAGLVAVMAVALVLIERRAIKAEREQIRQAWQSIAAERRRDVQASAMCIEAARLAHMTAEAATAEANASAEAAAKLREGLLALTGAVRTLIGRQDERAAELGSVIKAGMAHVAGAISPPSSRAPRFPPPPASVARSIPDAVALASLALPPSVPSAAAPAPAPEVSLPDVDGADDPTEVYRLTPDGPASVGPASGATLPSPGERGRA